MNVNARHDARAETTVVAITLRVERNARGQWLVAVPDRERIVCQTLDDARRAAYLFAPRAGTCELIVHDACHRVLCRELVNGEPAATSVDQKGTIAQP